MKKKESRKPIEKARRRRVSNEVADWGGLEDDLLRELISAITKSAGAVRFGYSRDGGAYSLGIYGDGKPFTEFLPGNADVVRWLRDIIEDYS